MDKDSLYQALLSKPRQREYQPIQSQPGVTYNYSMLNKVNYQPTTPNYAQEQSIWRVREEKANKNVQFYQKLLDQGSPRSQYFPPNPIDIRRVPSPLKTPQRIIKITSRMVDVGQRATQIQNPQNKEKFSNLKNAISNIVFPSKLSSIQEEEPVKKEDVTITVFEQHSYSSASLDENSYIEPKKSEYTEKKEVRPMLTIERPINHMQLEEDENKKMAERINKIMKENAKISSIRIDLPKIEKELSPEKQSSSDSSREESREMEEEQRNFQIQRNPSKKLLEMRKTAKLKKCFKNVKKTNPPTTATEPQTSQPIMSQQATPQIIYIPYPVIQQQESQKKENRKPKKTKSRRHKKSSKELNYQDIKEYLDKRELELLDKTIKVRSVTPKRAQLSKISKCQQTSNKNISTQKKCHHLRVIKDAQNSPIAVNVDNLRRDPVAFIVPFSSHTIPHSGNKGRSRSRTPKMRKRKQIEKPVKQVSRKQQVNIAKERLKRIKDYDNEMRKQKLCTNDQ